MPKAPIRQLFQLHPDIIFLNHGSFGACPLSVYDDYQRWQAKLEEEPIQFITKTGVKAYRQSKEVFAEWFNCSSDNFFFTPNPSTAFNTVMKSLELKEGDEILSTDLEYGAMDKTWSFICKETGAKYVQQHIPLPIQSKEQFLETFWSGLTPNTKIVFISHITSATALILPIEEICKKAKELGLITMIDGAHVPGHIPLNLDELQADYYTGALHKWLLAPKGCSFLHVKKEYQDRLDPLIVSWGYESEMPSHSRFLDYFEYTGTRDSSAYLVLPALKKFWDEENWLEQSKNAKECLHSWYIKFCDLLNTQAICPISTEFLGQMISVPISTPDPIELKELLYEDYKIEIPITNRGNEFFLRISYQAYNTEDELHYLYDCLSSVKSEGVHLQ
jgi:isopenicillin-N epimerase